MNDVHQQQTASWIERGCEVINWNSLLEFWKWKFIDWDGLMRLRELEFFSYFFLRGSKLIKLFFRVYLE